jgi:hypothetical protein
LHRIAEPSFRYYVRYYLRAGELKAAGMDWTEVLAVEAENLRERLAAENAHASCNASLISESGRVSASE